MASDAAFSTAPTAAPLTKTDLYSFVLLNQTTGKIDIDKVPGPLSSGVLTQLYTAAGIQYGVYQTQGQLPMLSGAAIAAGAEINHDAFGRAIPRAGAALPQGVAIGKCLAAGKTIVVELFSSDATAAGGGGGGGPAVPLGEVVIGTGPAVAGTANVTYDTGTGAFVAADTAAVGLLLVDGQPLSRHVKVSDEAGNAVLDVAATAAARLATFPDGAGIAVLQVQGKTTARRVFVEDGAGVAMVALDARTASRLATLADDLAKTIAEADTKTTARTLTASDDNGALISVLDTKVLNRAFHLIDELSNDVLTVKTIAALSKVIMGNVLGGGLCEMTFDIATGVFTYRTPGGPPFATIVVDGNKGTIATTAVSPAGPMALAENDYALATSAFGRLDPNGAGTTLSGLLLGRDGERKTIVNIAAPTLTVLNDSALSAIGNRIFTKTGAPVVLAQNGTMDLIYDVLSSHWREL